MGSRPSFSPRLLATYICIPPNSASPIQSCPILVRAAATRFNRLYLAFIPHRHILSSGGETGPVDKLSACSTSMWAGLRSSTVTAQSVLPALRRFASAIHGEVDPDLAQWFLQIRPVKTDCSSAIASMDHCRGESSITRNGSRMNWQPSR